MQRVGRILTVQFNLQGGAGGRSMDEVLAALESKFCKADIELFRLVAERTLPSGAREAAAEESADAARYRLCSPPSLLQSAAAATNTHPHNKPRLASGQS